MTGNANAQDGNARIFSGDERKYLSTYLRLLDSGSGGEVEMAAKKAREILKQHNLTFSTLADHPEWLAGKVSDGQFENLKQKLDDALDANTAYAAQNEAIREENDRLRRPGVKEKITNAKRRLTDIFTPAAAADGSAPRKHFLSTMFGTIAPGAIFAAVGMIDKPYDFSAFETIAIVASTIGSGAMTGFAAGFLADAISLDGGCLNFDKAYPGMFTGMVLSVALILGVVYGHEKPADPAPQGSAVERQLPDAQP